MLTTDKDGLQLLPAEGTMQEHIDLIADAAGEAEPGDALRHLTYLTELLRDNLDRIPAVAISAEPRMGDQRWATFICASINHALGSAAPTWSREQKPLAAPWFPMPQISLRKRAERTSPEYLRRQNIFVDANSLSRA